MILFTIKKAFFDIWDNLFSIVLLNVGLLFVLGGTGFLLQVLHSLGVHMLVFLLGAGIAIFLWVLYIGAASMIAGDIADYRIPELKNFLRYFKEIWKAALAFSLIVVFQLLVFAIVIPWYLGTGGFIGLGAAALLFWASVFWWLTAQYYFPVSNRLDTKIRKILLKSFTMFFDNTGFTFVLALGTLILMLLSGFTVFLLPGIGSILVWHQVGVKLRLYKYEYLETHPEAGKKHIPWNTLLKEDKKLVGKRSLKSMIFPWKE